MYGVIFMIGQLISTVSMLIIMLVVFRDVEPLPKVLNPTRVQDYGNFLMAFTMFWAYVQTSQLIILWSQLGLGQRVPTDLPVFHTVFDPVFPLGQAEGPCARMGRVLDDLHARRRHLLDRRPDL